ncbi:NAD(P)/FAD-dependent oxidoreductase [Pleurocapsa sp. PCC 7319]|uniref:FAD-dependent oxidoreductase n=1 Tax=Pleurocapsa sp. PCC 7319 TaxID=118161 RepID=UPI000346EDE9|nr:FAD-dependent monooxygenase [Pleurocapsa sp. PCC 7319]
MIVGGQILLIGDAVHAVSPSIGQGCNAALQDAMIFAQVLDEYQDDWEKALPAFTSKRLEDVHALRDLSDYTIPRTKWMTLELIFSSLWAKSYAPGFHNSFVLCLWS